MALWTDRDFVQPAELRQIDPEVLVVAREHSIALSGDTGMIRHSIDECGIELLGVMQSPGTPAISPAGIPSGHMAALLGPAFGQSTRLSLSQIIVSADRPLSMSPLKRWVLFRTLARVYASATERQSGDRYAGKWDRISQSIANQHWPFLVNNGVPMVRYPLAAPAAEGEPDAGTWSTANVTPVNGAGTEMRRFQVAVSYVGKDYLAPDDRHNAESALSRPVEVVVSGDPNPNAGDPPSVAVSIESLKPLADQSPVQRYNSFFYRMAVTGWNVWVGLAGENPMYLQTPTPLPIDTKQWSGAIIVPGGYRAHEGQWADLSLTVQRVFMRG